MKNLDRIIVPKGWGFEHWLANSPDYCAKVLHFNKGKLCSFHYHKRKTEHFHVIKNSFIIRYSFGDDLSLAESVILEEDDTFYVPRGLRHQMEALEEDSRLFETSTEHFEEDSYRIVKGD